MVILYLFLRVLSVAGLRRDIIRPRGFTEYPCTLSTDSSRDTIPIKRKYPTKMTHVSDPCAFSNLFVSENLEKTEEGRRRVGILQHETIANIQQSKYSKMLERTC